MLTLGILLARYELVKRRSARSERLRLRRRARGCVCSDE